MRAILVDDERPLLNELSKILDSVEEVEIVGAFSDPSKALSEAVSLKPELAFLDIEMPGINGLDLAERLAHIIPDINVLFITAYNHYATEAFAANALDYVLKPVRPERLMKAMGRVTRKSRQEDDESRAVLCIRSFGHFDVYLGDEPVKWGRSKQRELFAYLLHSEGQWVDKYRICDDLWRDYDPDQALSHLQTAVWAVRKLFRETGQSAVRLEYAHDCYMLLIGDTVWDRRQFDSLYTAALNAPDPEACRTAREDWEQGVIWTARIGSGRYWSANAICVCKRI